MSWLVGCVFFFKERERERERQRRETKGGAVTTTKGEKKKQNSPLFRSLLLLLRPQQTTKARLRALDPVAAGARGLALLRQLRGPSRLCRLRLGLRRGSRGQGRQRGGAARPLLGGPDAHARGLRAVRQGPADGGRVRGVGQVGDAVSWVVEPCFFGFFVLVFFLVLFIYFSIFGGGDEKLETQLFLPPTLLLFQKNKNQKSKSKQVRPRRRGEGRVRARRRGPVRERGRRRRSCCCRPRSRGGRKAERRRHRRLPRRPGDRSRQKKLVFFLFLFRVKRLQALPRLRGLRGPRRRARARPRHLPPRARQGPEKGRRPGLRGLLRVRALARRPGRRRRRGGGRAEARVRGARGEGRAGLRRVVRVREAGGRGRRGRAGGDAGGRGEQLAGGGGGL